MIRIETSKKRIRIGIPLFFVFAMICLTVIIVVVNAARRIVEENEEQMAVEKLIDTYNSYGLLNDGKLSDKVIYNCEDYLVYSDRVVEKMKILPDSAEYAAGVLKAFGREQKGKKIVVLPIPMRIQYEHVSLGSGSEYESFVRDLESRLDNGIILADPSAKLEGDDEFDFYRFNDTWTMNGAYFGYEIVCRKLGLAPYIRDHFKAYRSNDFLGNMYSKCHDDENVPERIVDTIAYAEYDPLVYRCSESFKNYETVYDNGLDAIYKRPVITCSTPGAPAIVGNNISTATLEGVGEGKILLITDLNGRLIAPYFTEHYEQVVVADLSRCSTPHLKMVMELNDFDAVVVAQKVSNIGLPGYSKVLNGFLE